MEIRQQLEIINQQIKELAGIYRGAVSHMDISENEFWIWYSLIIMEGEFSQQDICVLWSLSKQTVNTIITNMVRNGYAELYTVKSSRNRKIICLTDSGRKFGEQLILPVTLAEQRALEKLTVRERTVCTCAMRKYIDALKAEIIKND